MKVTEAAQNQEWILLQHLYRTASPSSEGITTSIELYREGYSCLD